MIGKIKNSRNIKKINISEVTKNQGLESSELIGILNKIDECKQDINDMGNIHKSIFRIIKNLKLKEKEEESIKTKEDLEKAEISFLENPAIIIHEINIWNHEDKRLPMLKYHMEYKFPIMIYKKNEIYFRSKLVNEPSRDQKKEIPCKKLEKRETKANETIKYDSLSDIEKITLACFCFKKLRKYRSSFKDNILEKISDIFRSSFKKDSYHIKKANTFVYTVGDHIMDVGIKKEGLFRISGKYTYYKFMPGVLAAGKRYDYTELSVHDNASIFKAYIREIMNGIISVQIAERVMKIIKNQTDPSIIEYIVPLIIFSITNENRKMLMYLQKIFRKVDQYSKDNKMGSDNLYKIFTPTIFPNIEYYDLQSINLQIKIVKRIFESNLTEIPCFLYEEAFSVAKNQ
ncbi:RhoGAP domain-containing protein [Hamiltosporidium tvaerminnensis]|uniref:RhoGAP domain-containing protein n=1 Tax=Hamiltosporidium tvaerminnensis TaxID=1176355 RepID=A0A4Q9LRU0_9MICR|nr:RhoGAP domain-containing protein [Hamiltosporidium tvaerminnensis]